MNMALSTDFHIFFADICYEKLAAREYWLE